MIRRILLALAAVATILGALAAIGAAQPTTTPVPSTTTASPSTTAPTNPTTSAPASSTASAPAAPGEDDCDGSWTVILGAGTCEVIGEAEDTITDKASDAGRAVLSDMVDWMLAGYLWVLDYVIGLFAGIDVDASNSVRAVQALTDMTGELQIIALGLGALVAVLQIIANRLYLVGDNAAPEAFSGFLKWAAAATLAAPVLLGLSEASDALSNWIFTASAADRGGPSAVVGELRSALTGRDERLKTEDVITLALCILGLFAYIELAIQLLLQKAWIIYATVVMPIAGAASVTGAGKAVFWAIMRLAVTVLLFKPVAAILFATAFWQIKTMDSGTDVVTAVLLMAAPAFCMPTIIGMIGTNSVAWSGTPMLRGSVRAAQSMGRFTSRQGRNALDGWREGQSRADARDAASGNRAEARAVAAPTNSASTTATATPKTSTRAQVTSGTTGGGAPATAGSRATRTASGTAGTGSAGSGPNRSGGSGNSHRAAGNSSRSGQTSTTTPPSRAANARRTSAQAGTTAGANASRPTRSSQSTPPTPRRTASTATSATGSTASAATRRSSSATGSSSNASTTNTGTSSSDSAGASAPAGARWVRRPGTPRDTSFNRIT